MWPYWAAGCEVEGAVIVPPCRCTETELTLPSTLHFLAGTPPHILSPIYHFRFLSVFVLSF
jgi:hypothetical protein